MPTEMIMEQMTSGQTSWLPIRVEVALYHSTLNVEIAYQLEHL